jgi:hypothetical protein
VTIHSVSFCFILPPSAFICLRRRTDSPGAAKSAESLIRLTSRPAACALSTDWSAGCACALSPSDAHRSLALDLPSGGKEGPGPPPPGQKYACHSTVRPVARGIWHPAYSHSRETFSRVFYQFPLTATRILSKRGSLWAGRKAPRGLLTGERGHPPES